MRSRAVRIAAMLILSLLGTAPGALAQGCPEPVSQWGYGMPLALAVTGGHALVGAGTFLVVIDIRDPSSPEIVGDLDVGEVIRGVAVRRDVAYLATGNYTDFRGHLVLVDVQDPTRPELLSSMITPVDARDVAVQGRFAYLVLGAPDGGRLQVVDVSTPEHPEIVGEVTTTSWLEELEVEGPVAAVREHDQGVRLFALDRGPTPVEVARILFDRVDRIALASGLLSVTAGLEGLIIYDVSDPESAREVGSRSGVFPYSITSIDGSTYGLSGTQLCWVGVDQPDLPSRCTWMWNQYTGWRRFQSGLLQQIEVRDGRLYTIGYERGFEIIDISDAGEPRSISILDLPRGAHRTSVRGDLALVNLNYAGAILVDLADRRRPDALGNIDLLNSPMQIWPIADVALGESVAFGEYPILEMGGPGFKVVDVSDPGDPAVIGSGWEDGNGLVLYDGTLIHGVGNTDSLWSHFYDVTDPAHPSRFRIIPGKPLAMIGARAFLGGYSWSSESCILSIASPIRPRPEVVGSYTWNSCAGASWEYPWPEARFNVPQDWEIHKPPHDAAQIGPYLLVAMGGLGLSVLDIHDPAAPEDVARLHPPGQVMSVEVAGHTAYVATQVPSGLRVYNVAQATGPVELDFHPLPGFPLDLELSNGFAHVSNQVAGLSILDLRYPCTAPRRPIRRLPLDFDATGVAARAKAERATAVP